jgi:hypothetical protein
MRYQGKGMTPLRITTVVVVAGIALAGYSGVTATKSRAGAPAAAEAPATVAYQDPSLAGLKPGPQAEPGGDVETYY